MLLATIPVMRWISVLGLLGAMTGCGTLLGVEVTVTPLNPAPRPPMRLTADMVAVYSSEPPKRPHVDLALLEADNPGLSASATIQALRARAAALGCEAVYINGVGVGDRLAGSPRLFSSDDSLHATCVVFTDTIYLQPAAAVASSAPPRPGERRMCPDRQDFESHRDCVVPRAAD